MCLHNRWHVEREMTDGFKASSNSHTHSHAHFKFHSHPLHFHFAHVIFFFRFTLDTVAVTTAARYHFIIIFLIQSA